jgi:hypothetical protein
MQRIWTRTSPWMGSALVHAAVLLALAWWIIADPAARGPVSLSIGSADEALPPALMEADESEVPAIEVADPQELLSAAEEPLAVADPESLLSRGKSGTGLSVDVDFAALGSGRRGRAVEFFGAVAHGEKIVFILDVSGSMGDNRYRGAGGGSTRFERAREELVRTIYQLYADQKFVVLLFSSDCRPMFDQPLRQVDFYAATPHHKDRVARWLEGVHPGGATDPRSSLRTALALYPDAIFLLSDGEFRSGRGLISSQVIRLVEGLNAHKVPIHTIAYQDFRSRRTLETIAELTGGMFRFVE